MSNDLSPPSPDRFGLVSFSELLPPRDPIIGEDPGSFDGFHEGMMASLTPITPSFCHDTFASDCDRFIGPQCISYNSSQLVKDRFQGWTVEEFAHTYTMRSVGSYNTDQASRKELVLFNYEV